MTHAICNWFVGPNNLKGNTKATKDASLACNYHTIYDYYHLCGLDNGGSGHLCGLTSPDVISIIIVNIHHHHKYHYLCRLIAIANVVFDFTDSK